MAEIKDPVNWAIEEMRHESPRTFRIQQFVKATGVSVDQLQYHDKNPDAKWTSATQRFEMAAFFKEHFNCRIVADHVNCKMVKVEDNQKSNYTAGQLMDLCVELNCDEFHVWCELHGHINMIEVEVAPNGWVPGLALTKIGQNYSDQDYSDTLEQIRDRLLDAYNKSRRM